MEVFYVYYLQVVKCVNRIKFILGVVKDNLLIEKIIDIHNRHLNRH